MKSYSGHITVPNDFVPFTAPAAAPAGCRGIAVTSAGTINATMKNGAVRTGIPVVIGINPGQFASVQTGGTATGLFWII